MSTPNEPNLLNSKPDRQKEADNDLVFSYLTLRTLIGICGILLPVILFFLTKKGNGDRSIEPSISDYYYTSNGDVLVLLLSVLGVFLFTYNGYTLKEKMLTNLAAICALGIAFTPTSTSSASSKSIHFAIESGPEWFGIPKHFIFAFLFFACVAIMSLHYFPLSDKENKRTKRKMTQKDKRNITYKICGWVILGCLGTLGLYFIIEPEFAKDFPVVFVFESIAIWAFGISWLTKGETLWPDPENNYWKRFGRFFSKKSAALQTAT